MIQQIKTALILFLLLTVVTGLLYPAVVTGFAQLFFSKQANGSLLLNSQNQIIGSALIGQSFTNPKYFWGRPSATIPVPYNAMASSASNLGPTNPDLFTLIKNRVLNLKQVDPKNSDLIPVDLVTASASGLDPDISPAAAFYQVRRVAKARGLTESQVKKLVQEHIQDRTWGILGEPRVNVLMLNLALEQRFTYTQLLECLTMLIPTSMSSLSQHKSTNG